MKHLLLVILLAGCSTTVPVKVKFPEPPKYMGSCPQLEKLKEDTKLKIYEIISLSYIRVNGGIDTLLQLCGCISKIYLYFDK